MHNLHGPGPLEDKQVSLESGKEWQARPTLGQMGETQARQGQQIAEKLQSGKLNNWIKI